MEQLKLLREQAARLRAASDKAGCLEEMGLRPELARHLAGGASFSHGAEGGLALGELGDRG